MAWAWALGNVIIHWPLDTCHCELQVNIHIMLALFSHD